MRFSVINTPRTLKFALLAPVLFMGMLRPSFAQQSSKEQITKIDPVPFDDDTHHWYGIADKGNVINPRPGHPRYQPTEIAKIADNILLYQKNNGGWPKNYDMFAILSEDQKDSLIASKNVLNTTYDNGSTYTQIAALATAYKAIPDEKYKKSALRGLDFVLESQYGNGGWPQYYPLEDNYSRCITYNDGAFIGIMNLLSDIIHREPQYDFIDNKHFNKLTAAYNKGLDCILKTQINDDGKPTAWCQQYNEKTLQPAWARKFEPPSICNGESSELVLFLMNIDHPNKQIIDAIQNAVIWFQDSRIYHTRVKVIPAPRMVTPFRVSTTDRVVVDDPTAPPIWTRYYELKTHKPLFCNRDSKVVYSLAEVLRERRDGYGWYTYAPQRVLDHYKAWQQKWVSDQNVLK